MIIVRLLPCSFRRRGYSHLGRQFNVLIGCSFEGGAAAGRALQEGRALGFEVLPGSRRGPDRSIPALRQCARRLRGCEDSDQQAPSATGTRRSRTSASVTAYSRAVRLHDLGNDVRGVWADRRAHIGADQGHAGDLHGALAVPLHQAARGFVADGAGAGDCRGLPDRAWIERSPGPTVTAFGSATLQCQFCGHIRGRGKLRSVSFPPITEIIRAAPSAEWSCRNVTPRHGRGLVSRGIGQEAHACKAYLMSCGDNFALGNNCVTGANAGNRSPAGRSCLAGIAGIRDFGGAHHDLLVPGNDERRGGRWRLPCRGQRWERQRIAGQNDMRPAHSAQQRLARAHRRALADAVDPGSGAIDYPSGIHPLIFSRDAVAQQHAARAALGDIDGEHFTVIADYRSGIGGLRSSTRLPGAQGIRTAHLRSSRIAIVARSRVRAAPAPNPFRSGRRFLTGEALVQP